MINSNPDGLFPLLRVDGSTNLPDQILILIGQPVHIQGTLSYENGFPVIDAEIEDIQPTG